MSASRTQPPTARTGWPRVRVHPGAGLVDRRGDSLLVVPVLPSSSTGRVRALLDLCSRPDRAGQARAQALRALVRLQSPAEVPGFALVVRAGHSLHLFVHGPVRVLVDGHPPVLPEAADTLLAEHVLEDGAWHELAVGGSAVAEAPDAVVVLPLDLPLDLEAGTVPGAGVTLDGVPAADGPPSAPPAAAAPPAGAPTSATALRPAVRFRTVLLGECAVGTTGGGPAPGRRGPPLPFADERRAVTTGPEVLVEGVLCPRGHFTDPDQPRCPACGEALPPDGQRVRLPRPPLGIVVTDGGTIYPVTGDFVIGREAERAPDVLAGRARPLPLRDDARSTSRVHARLTVTGWRVLLSDDGSANGTLVSRHGAAGPWLPVTPHAPLALVHGDRVRMGQRQLLFDTWRDTVVPQVVR